ncbi:MAG: PL29 family lyase N-terminal domain-containing protein [Paludibacteraceae bacterium]|nr:PL29 family lyase N-terminal domain-containing protein [Paludibacteraceae bacterium]
MMKLKHRFIQFALVLVCLFAVSCEKYDDEISEIKKDLAGIKESLAELQRSYNEGKIITSVTPVEEKKNDWLITFSDNTTITINSGNDGVNGIDGVTPYVKIDDNNYWTVSYDNGKTYVPLVDSNGNPVVAKGDTGEDGNSVRVVVGEDMYYVIEVYNPTTGNVVDRIVSPYSSNP